MNAMVNRIQGTIRQRGDAWQADTSAAGKRVRKSFHTREAAEEWLRGLSGAPQGNGRSPVPRTLGPLMERLWELSWSDSRTAPSLRSSVDMVVRFFGASARLDQIDSDWIEAFKAHERTRGMAPGSINRRLSMLSRALHYAHENGALARVPSIRRGKVAETRLVWLSEEEEHFALEWLRQIDQGLVADLVTVLVDTGARPDELLRAKAADFDRRAGAITLMALKTGTWRTVPLTKRASKVLEARAKVAGADGRLFPLAYPYVRVQWQKLRDRMERTEAPAFTLYITRHTFASRLAQRGVPIQVISKLLGHASITQTMVYAKLSGRNLEDAIRELER